MRLARWAIIARMPNGIEVGRTFAFTKRGARRHADNLERMRRRMFGDRSSWRTTVERRA